MRTFRVTFVRTAALCGLSFALVACGSSAVSYHDALATANSSRQQVATRYWSIHRSVTSDLASLVADTHGDFRSCPTHKGSISYELDYEVRPLTSTTESQIGLEQETLKAVQSAGWSLAEEPAGSTSGTNRTYETQNSGFTVREIGGLPGDEKGKAHGVGIWIYGPCNTIGTANTIKIVGRYGSKASDNYDSLQRTADQPAPVPVSPSANPQS